MKAQLSADLDLCKFYRASNSVLNVLTKPSEIVLMRLLYSNCVPIITYGCNVKDLSNKDMQNCTVAVNNSIRRIFSFRRWESTRFLRESFGFKSLEEIFSRAKKKFENSLCSHSNIILRDLYHIVSS